MNILYTIVANWVKNGNHWKYVIVVLIAVAAFFAGKYTTTQNTKVVTQTVTVHDTQVSSKDTESSSKVQIQYVDRPVDRIITKTIIKEVSGKVTETSTESVHEGNTTVNTTEDRKKETQVQTKTEIIYKDRIVEKTVQAVPDLWRAGVLAGIGPTSKNYIPTVPSNVVLGGFVERSIWGKLNGGIWVNSRLDIGIQVSRSF